MNALFFLKNRFRRYIFPTQELLMLLARYLPDRPIRILDVGCGSGWFLRTLLEKAPSESCGIGVEVDTRYYTAQVVAQGNNFSIQSPESLEEKQNFDFLLFNDVLHHVRDKKDFLLCYLHALTPGGYVFIKDMSNDHFITTMWNRFHDKLLSGDSISEISFKEISNILGTEYECLCYQKKRIFLYDHFWCLFKKLPNME